ncbi:hypothetical protein ACFVIM_32825 [Streptomyces sp. NPDC057638]|uniref:hypothetical protein n=1 Tax=Streptomyces sp. NPDC057638 TaxID=3346190 RepID=UPI00368B83DA
MNATGARDPIGDIIISSRPYAEYREQFALSTERILTGPVLDCPGGASDFAATVRSLGGTAISVDPSYRMDAPRLATAIDDGLARVRQWTAAQPDRFDLDASGQWTHVERWADAAGVFLRDYRRDRAEGTGHYRAASLPVLPFPSDSFSLAVSGFLLFTYPRHFDRAAHLTALCELCRVAREVRLHPLNDSAGVAYPALGSLLRDLGRRGIEAELLPVRGQSDRRDDRTLRLTRG